MYESNMSVLRKQFKNGFALRKLLICVISFVTLLSITVLYTPIIQDRDFLMRLLGPFKSTCSYSADRRGPNQRIISYSVYGNFSRHDHIRKYVLPLKETLNSIPSIYPGWIVRIYHNLKKDDIQNWESFKSHLLEIGSRHVDICNATEVIENRKLETNLGDATWRWLPMLDEMVETVMSRDSDSRIIPREEDAVREWLASDRIYHIMRDHPNHCTTFILAGMWGVKVSHERPQIAGLFQKIFNMEHKDRYYGYDQKFLKDYVWPIAQTNMVSHDSYCCGDFPFTRPYPSPRNNGHFIGERNIPSEALRFPCPVKCRPVNATPEWNYC